MIEWAFYAILFTRIYEFIIFIHQIYTVLFKGDSAYQPSSAENYQTNVHNDC